MRQDGERALCVLHVGLNSKWGLGCPEWGQVLLKVFTSVPLVTVADMPMAENQTKFALSGPLACHIPHVKPLLDTSSVLAILRRRGCRDFPVEAPMA